MNSMSENKNLTKAAGIVGAATLSSRLLGFVRDVMIAVFFGTGFYSDAFITAFRIPEVLRKLFSEGSLTVAFIPVFTRYVKENGLEDAFDMARSFIYKALSVFLVIVGIGMIWTPEILFRVAHGIADFPEKFKLTVLLTRIMSPYILFICVVAVFMGILNALGHFTAPALAPCVLNISMIGSLFMVSAVTEDPRHIVIGLAVGVVAGGGLQVLVQIPALAKKKFTLFKKSSLSHPGVKEISRMVPPAVFSAGVYQLNILVTTFLATLLSEGSVSYLYYADRLVQFPLGLFAISVATAVIPTLSIKAAENDIPGVKDTFAYGLRLIFFIVLPSMVGLMVLREPIISLLFRRGAFSTASVTMTAQALFYYCVGLWAIAGVRITIPVFYALQNVKTPVVTAVISIIANIVFSVILMPALGHGGLALSTSFASILNLILLLYAMHKLIGTSGFVDILISFAKSAAGSLMMGVVIWMISLYIIPCEDPGNLTLAFGIFCSIIIGVIFYGIFSYLIKNQELEFALSMFGRNRTKG